MSKFLFAAFFALGLSLPAIGQTTELTCSGLGAGPGAQGNTVRSTGIGTPYTLTAIIRTERKLLDGKTSSMFATARQMRDTWGRTRVEIPGVCLEKENQTHWQGSVLVTDAIANTYTAWMIGDPEQKVLISHVLPSLKVANPLSPQDEYSLEKRIGEMFQRAGPDSKLGSQQVEDLGKRDILGLQTSGMRITTRRKWETAGGSQTIISVEEKWISDQFRMILLDIKDDSILGKSTYEASTFSRDEPDASLFQPPEGLEVEERNMKQ